MCGSLMHCRHQSAPPPPVSPHPTPHPRILFRVFPSSSFFFFGCDEIRHTPLHIPIRTSPSRPSAISPSRPTYPTYPLSPHRPRLTTLTLTLTLPLLTPLPPLTHSLSSKVTVSSGRRTVTYPMRPPTATPPSCSAPMAVPSTPTPPRPCSNGMGKTTGVQVFRCSRCSGVQVFRCAGVQVFRCLGVS